MKRFMKMLLAAAAVICLVAGSSLAEDIYSYDFDLRFHMTADIFPSREQAHMQGYADLLNILELRGNLTVNPAADSFDLNASLIPVTNPDSAVSFRLYGYPENMGLTSSLLGDEALWFQNYVLMEFALKTYNNLHYPLQHIVLLYPYVTESAFRRLSEAWEHRIGNIRKNTVISSKELAKLADEWSEIRRTDDRLKYWIYALSLPAKNGIVMETEFSRLSDYFRNQVTGGGRLHIRVDGDTVIWTNDMADVLFTRTDRKDFMEWTLQLPPTENGYLPQLNYRSSSDGGLRDFHLEGSYNLIGDHDSSSSMPESLLSVLLDLKGLPVVWPMNSEISAALQIGGIIYPNTDLMISGSCAEDGKIHVSVSEVSEENGLPLEFLTCSGTIVPVSPVSVPSYSLENFTSFQAIYNVNDKTMDEFIHRIRRPLFFGILNFLNELPASSCRSVMDDLEEYGILDMVLVD